MPKLILPAALLLCAVCLPAGEPPAPPRNPFVYQGTGEDDGLVPASSARLPHGIRLAAVLVRRDGGAIAVLRLPGEPVPLFVREGDLVSIAPKPTAHQAGGTAARTAEDSPFFLLIHSVTPDGVEVAPRVRPTEVHLIR